MHAPYPFRHGLQKTDFGFSRNPTSRNLEPNACKAARGPRPCATARACRSAREICGRSYGDNIQHTADNTRATFAQGRALTKHPERRFMGLGIWLGGVACKWDHSSSIDMVSMSLPGQSGKFAPLRAPLCALGSEWVAGGYTFDDILADNILAAIYGHMSMLKIPAG